MKKTCTQNSEIICFCWSHQYEKFLRTNVFVFLDLTSCVFDKINVTVKEVWTTKLFELLDPLTFIVKYDIINRSLQFH